MLRSDVVLTLERYKHRKVKYGALKDTGASTAVKEEKCK